MPAQASWLGQLIAAAWLSVAFYNWNTRDTMLGGIYGRPAVLLNLGVYFVSALALLKASPALPAVRLAAVPFALLALVYAVLMLRGPLDRSALPLARAEIDETFDHRLRMDTVSFRSRIDLWVPLVLLGPAGLALWLIAAEHQHGPRPALLIGALVCVLVLALGLWLLLDTVYTLTPTELVVRHGPFRTTIPVSAVRAV